MDPETKLKIKAKKNSLWWKFNFYLVVKKMIEKLT